MTNKEDLARCIREFGASHYGMRYDVNGMAYQLFPYSTLWSQPSSGHPTAEALADDIMESAEFEGVKLGTFLTTPEGSLIADAVGLVFPQALGGYYELFVMALTLVANRQQNRDQAFVRVIFGGLVMWVLLCALARLVSQ
jgi:hypothetical protein